MTPGSRSIRHLIEEPPSLERHGAMVYVDYATAGGDVLHLAMRMATLTRAIRAATEFIRQQGGND